MVQKEQIKVQILQTFKQSGQNLPNSCYFWNNKSVFLQILLHSSVSWDIALMYFFSWNFIYLQQRKPIKLQIWWSFTGEVKSLKFCILMGSFCPNDIKFHLKKCRRVISYHNEEWCKVYAKYDRKYARNLVNFHLTTQKSENFTSMGSFYSKYLRFELKKYRRVIFYDTEHWCKIRIPWPCGFKNGMNNWVNFH